ncbi:MAG: hypothetical protein NT154_22435, partial [Verrucomicrobia bacterium]|nr:hypothetical protein [Verrucomicrobiota bacterium]
MKNSMRASLTFLVAFLLAGTTSYGGLYTFNSSPNGTIPDGNPTGFQDTITVSGLSSLDSVTVYLNVSGGYNGDL